MKPLKPVVHVNFDFNSAAYASQLALALGRFDRLIFSPYHMALQPVIIHKRFSPPREKNFCVSNLAMYHAVTVGLQVVKDFLGTDHMESYVIWGKEVEHYAERKLAGWGMLTKFGDAEFGDLLLAHAFVAIRHRVLQHRQLFPKAGFRTLASVYRDKTVPESHRQSLFQKKSEIPVRAFADPLALDAYLLLLLLDMARSDGYPVEEMFSYLIS